MKNLLLIPALFLFACEYESLTEYSENNTTPIDTLFVDSVTGDTTSIGCDEMQIKDLDCTNWYFGDDHIEFLKTDYDSIWVSKEELLESVTEIPEYSDGDKRFYFYDLRKQTKDYPKDYPYVHVVVGGNRYLYIANYAGSHHGDEYYMIVHAWLAEGDIEGVWVLYKLKE